MDKINIIMLLGLMVLWILMHYKIKKQKINFKYIYKNYVMLFVFLILLIPGVLVFLVSITGFIIPSNFIFTLIIAYLFYMSFLQQIELAKNKEELNKLSRIISLYSKGDNDEKNRD